MLNNPLNYTFKCAFYDSAFTIIYSGQFCRVPFKRLLRVARKEMFEWSRFAALSLPKEPDLGTERRYDHNTQALG